MKHTLSWFVLLLGLLSFIPASAHIPITLIAAGGKSQTHPSITDEQTKRIVRDALIKEHTMAMMTGLLRHSVPRNDELFMLATTK